MGLVKQATEMMGAGECRPADFGMQPNRRGMKELDQVVLGIKIDLMKEEGRSQLTWIGRIEAVVDGSIASIVDAVVVFVLSKLAHFLKPLVLAEDGGDWGRSVTASPTSRLAPGPQGC
ncbi:uncharacterized protein PG998_013565 [Apiospora kogelbergensis]|uniref:uncharacterized protein n=1 Tax=Apiospora kogelbergensis TaxID=1337665 RepID=UPI00312EB8E9